MKRRMHMTHNTGTWVLRNATLLAVAGRSRHLIRHLTVDQRFRLLCALETHMSPILARISTMPTTVTISDAVMSALVLLICRFKLITPRYFARQTQKISLTIYIAVRHNFDFVILKLETFSMSTADWLLDNELYPPPPLTDGVWEMPVLVGEISLCSIMAAHPEVRAWRDTHGTLLYTDVTPNLVNKFRIWLAMNWIFLRDYYFRHSLPSQNQNEIAAPGIFIAYRKQGRKFPDHNFSCGKILFTVNGCDISIKVTWTS